MKEITAYEMSFTGTVKKSDISCVPFREKYWNEYMKIYDECFSEMEQ